MTIEIDPKLKEEWPEKTRKSRTQKIAHGYMRNYDDDFSLLPDFSIIPYYEKAFDALDADESFRNVANWLNTQPIGRTISHMGIKQMWLEHRGKTSQRAKEDRKRLRAIKPKTYMGKKLRAEQYALGAAKRSVLAKQRHIDKIAPPPKPTPQPVILLDGNTNPEREDGVQLEIAFKPNEGPQTQFLAAPEREVLYGGAAGGGKSYALISDPLRYFANPNFNGLLLRRTNDELRELITKAAELYSKTFPGTKFNAKASTFTFPSGAKLWMAYLDNDRDVERYQGQSFCWIGFDELTHYSTPYAWDYLRSRLRTTDSYRIVDIEAVLPDGSIILPDGTIIPKGRIIEIRGNKAGIGLPLCMRATTNPGGPGHGWVKKMFIDPAPSNTPFPARDLDTDEVMTYSKHYRIEELRGQPLFYRRFIQAFLSDNPFLYEDGQYEANLLSLTEMRRRQLLEGDWTIADGAAFPEFQLKHHVIEPFTIPSTWRRFRSCDFGYSSHSAVHWYTMDPIYDTLIVYRELYVSKKTAKELANMILALEKDEKILYGIMDSSVFHVRGNTGPNIAEEMSAEGCRWRPSDRTSGSRINGKNRLHELLKVRELGTDDYGNPIQKPGIQFFSTCRQIIADLPVIPMDPDGGEDIDDRFASDHTYDSIRYGIMSRPRPNSIFDFGTAVDDPYRPVDRFVGY